MSLYSKPEESGELKFRHDYSGIAIAIFGGAPPSNREEVAEATSSIELVSSNIDQVWQYLSSEQYAEFDEVLPSFRKLKSHIALEMQRMTMFNSVYGDIGNIGGELIETKDSLKSTVNEAKKELTSTRDELKDMRRDYIAILGLFAAVVLVINASIGISASTVSEIAPVFSMANVVLILFVVGFISITLTAVLLYFIWFLVRPNKESKVPLAALLLALAADVVFAVGVIWLFAVLYPSMVGA